MAQLAAPIGIEEFESPFWSNEEIIVDGKTVDIDAIESIICVARMAQANKHVRHDVEEFARAAEALIDPFLEI